MRSETGAGNAFAHRGSPCARAAGQRWDACSRKRPSSPTRARSPRIRVRARRSFASSRKRPVAFRGRHWIAFWLVALLAALWLVVARQTAALTAARSLATLGEERAALEGRRAELERRVRAGQSRAVLLPRAQKLGLRLPADTEIILIPTPQPRERP